MLTVGTISAYSVMKSNESLRKEEEMKEEKRKKDFACSVMKNNESLRKEVTKKTENIKVQTDPSRATTITGDIASFVPLTRSKYFPGRLINYG